MPLEGDAGLARRANEMSAGGHLRLRLRGLDNNLELFVPYRAFPGASSGRRWLREIKDA